MDDRRPGYKTRWTGWLLILFGVTLAVLFALMAVFIAGQAVNVTPLRIGAVPVGLSLIVAALGVALVRRAD